MAQMKFKARKNSRKGKTPRNSFKSSSKPTRKSFLEENIKNAGKTSIRKKSLVPPIDKDDSDEEAEKSLLTQDADEKNTNTNKEDGQEKLRQLYAKERNDLQQAHDVLLQEYRRRRAIRKNILSKFGRASCNLKIILAQKRAWNDPDHSTRNDAIREVFVAKPISDSKPSENRQRFKYNRFDDVDRI